MLGENQSIDMECDMNSYAELLCELRRNEILEDVNAFRNAEAI